jgi:RimJ/RimL family protein N-acetyltransferase
LKGFDTAIGIFQVRASVPDFSLAEWGFALGSPFWGTGIFQEAAELVLEFVFETLGVHRLEARAAVRNGRGNGALLKLGAVQEARLRKSFLRDGQYLDQVMYAIIEDDWRDVQNGVVRRSPASIQVH